MRFSTSEVRRTGIKLCTPRHLLSRSNLILILLIGAIVLLFSVQEHDNIDEGDFYPPRLDYFIPATYTKLPSMTTSVRNVGTKPWTELKSLNDVENAHELPSKQEIQASINAEAQASINPEAQASNNPEVQQSDNPEVQGINNPEAQNFVEKKISLKKFPLPMPVIKYLTHISPRPKLPTRNVKLITPQKQANQDVLNAMAHPRLFPTQQQPSKTRNDRHTSSGMNDWVLANSHRDSFKFLVYSAYWDDRFAEHDIVRIMAIMVTKNPPPVFCRLQMIDGKYLDAKVTRKVMNEHWKLKYSSCFLSCEVVKNTKPPLRALVSLNRNFTFSAMLPVHQNKENIASARGDLAVCVKPLHYSYNRATWLLEFIEFHRVLGVEHFFFYNHTVGPQVDALLRSYISQNVVTVLPWNLPVVSQKEIRTEAIFSSLNDCVFRTMYLFHYVILLDFDEYIVPREHETYLDMLHQLEEDNKNIRGRPGSFVFKNVFFYLYWENDTTVYGVEPEKPPQWVPYLITQYKTRRLSTSMKVGSRSKYIIVPERVVEVGNHVVWRHTSGSRAISVQDTTALLHHYRICEFGGFSCLKKDNLVDRTATRFGPDLLGRVERQCKIIFHEKGGKCPLSPPLGTPW